MPSSKAVYRNKFHFYHRTVGKACSRPCVEMIKMLNQLAATDKNAYAHSFNIPRAQLQSRISLHSADWKYEVEEKLKQTQDAHCNTT